MTNLGSPAPTPWLVTGAPPRAATHVARPNRGSVLITAVLASAGGAGVYLAALPAQLRASTPYGICFAVLGLFQIGAAIAVLVLPCRRRLLVAAAGAAIVAAWWGVDQLGLMPDPDPWQPVNTVIGATGAVEAGLQVLAVVLLAVLAVRGPRRPRSPGRRMLTGLAVTPVLAAVSAGVVLGIVAASDGFAGAGFPAGTVAPRGLAAGQRSTVEYCRPQGVPLAMDVYTPPATARRIRPAPVVLYVHGGGMVLGDRKTIGLGANLANHDGALFTGVRQRLGARGFVVASIDYRLPPGTAWPAQIQDAKCAVRFLRAHASSLGIDPARIGAWGSSAGANLACLLGLAGPTAGFDTGQYPEQSSAVQAVVDMFGAADLTDLADSSPFMRTMVHIALGAGAMRRAASPITYVRPGAPPFLILHGTQDQTVRPRQSERLARALRTSGVPATLIKVEGAAHGLDIEGQRPTPEQLATTVADFLGTTLE